MQCLKWLSRRRRVPDSSGLFGNTKTTHVCQCALRLYNQMLALRPGQDRAAALVTLQRNFQAIDTEFSKPEAKINITFWEMLKYLTRILDLSIL